MKAVPGRITIQVYSNQDHVETRQYENPPKPAAEILRSLKRAQLVGVLRRGDVSLSASDKLSDANVYQHLRETGGHGVLELHI